MDDENFETSRVMFGDPFGNRGDYSKGIFYGGRRRYLHSREKREDKEAASVAAARVNILEPPTDFMTLKQKRNNVKLRKGGITLMQRLEFKKSIDFDDGSKSQVKKVEATKSRMVITHQQTHKSDWIKETQAGCTFWVHRDTGITSMVDPMEEPEAKVNYARDDEDDEKKGTGSLVYDSTDFETLLHELDSCVEEKGHAEEVAC
jgi:hypothetical protein